MHGVDRKEASREHARWLKRQAVQIVAQLPENERDALKVLSYAQDLVSRFIGEDMERRGFGALRLVSDFEEEGE